MQQTSRVTVKVDGDAFRSKAGSASINPGGLYAQDSEMTDQGDFVHKRKWVRCEIKVTLIHVSDTDLIKIRDMPESTVTYEPDVGKKYTTTNAVCSEIGELRDGEVEVTIHGDPAKAA